MTWDSENNICPELVDVAQETILDEEIRREFYKKLIKLLNAHDPEAVDEALGIDDLFDEVFEEYSETSSNKNRNSSEDEEDYDVDDGSDYFRRAAGDEE